VKKEEFKIQQNVLKMSLASTPALIKEQKFMIAIKTF
jgi:hypothetical protein